jgi:hypothetical protein
MLSIDGIQFCSGDGGCNLSMNCSELCGFLKGGWCVIQGGVADSLQWSWVQVRGLGVGFVSMIHVWYITEYSSV